MTDQEPAPGQGKDTGVTKEGLKAMIDKLKKPEMPAELAATLAKDEIELDKKVDDALKELKVDQEIPAKPNSTPLQPEVAPTPESPATQK